MQTYKDELPREVLRNVTIHFEDGEMLAPLSINDRGKFADLLRTLSLDLVVGEEGHHSSDEAEAEA
jgi:hypothetical protein